MLLIADSGSTKTDWKICKKSEIITFQTIGMNPYFVSSSAISTILAEEFPCNLIKEDITKILFFGAGCKANSAKQIIIEGLQKVFLKAEIIVKTDLEGAAISLLGNNSGNICILGTGMSIGFWNGSEISMSLPSLGFILGDEGSGAYIGKLFIKGIFEESFDSEIIDDFNNTYGLDLPIILENIYKKPMPNQYLASFVYFVYKHKINASIDLFLQKIFSEFVNKHVRDFSKQTNLNSINCIGSVAFWFKDIISEELHKHSIVLQSVEASPIEKLCDFYNK